MCAVAEALAALNGRRFGSGRPNTISRGCHERASSRTTVHFATHDIRRERDNPEGQGRARVDPHTAQGWRTPAELEEDDGLLTASEVAQLNLDADWVVLSACSTAAGETSDAEALSGLAPPSSMPRRALLVSHSTRTRS